MLSLIEVAGVFVLAVAALTLPGALFGGSAIEGAAITTVTWTVALVLGWWRYENREDA